MVAVRDAAGAFLAAELLPAIHNSVVSFGYTTLLLISDLQDQSKNGQFQNMPDSMTMPRRLNFFINLFFTFL